MCGNSFPQSCSVPSWPSSPGRSIACSLRTSRGLAGSDRPTWSSFPRSASKGLRGCPHRSSVPPAHRLLRSAISSPLRRPSDDRERTVGLKRRPMASPPLSTANPPALAPGQPRRVPVQKLLPRIPHRLSGGHQNSEGSAEQPTGMDRVSYPPSRLLATPPFSAKLGWVGFAECYFS
jgi:hypothetical protein